jgi:hypothetical protein
MIFTKKNKKSNDPGQTRPISSHRHNLKSNGVMPINIQLEPLFEDKKKNKMC